MSHPLRLGIAGLGTVGVGVIKIVMQHGDMLRARSGRDITISAVSARSKSKDRGVDLSNFDWEDDPVALATRDDVDVYVELMGGEDGPALASVKAALNAGKHVVTANKAMLAIHGQELAELAEFKGVNLRFEAAVAGGIPIIKSLTESLAGNKITRVMGVMNGTCNYILTRMETAGLPYDEVFEEANQLGYLEADPNLDVGGIDAAHKLVLLSSIAYGTQVDFASAQLQGIQRISIVDIKHAAEMGYRIKLLGVSQMTDAGLIQTMRPCLVPALSPLGLLEGGTNMVIVEGDSVGQIVLRGAGAGEGPTASAVFGDVMDIARGINIPVFGIPAAQLTKSTPADSSGESAYYMRLNLKDKAGAMASASSALADAGISIDKMTQHSSDDNVARVLIVTHPTTGETASKAAQAIENTGVLELPPVVLKIETV
ncbi:homoserine dehydrogenase [Amylibacter kogurei]|uniref:Homoserine dehydrogenase n=1 Tax=Paramylibacter kogurei TaxID=1889778 RepID=A0A2G5K8Q1_9RHOB|nr:homoserine dehydrogenase [Amylibacter kogurei]PIB25918.1 homoserine dehydrogenase [Amylibacter kogurei]